MSQLDERSFRRRSIGRRSYLRALVVALFCVLPLRAQDTVHITLPQAIDIAAERNTDLIRAENTLRTARTRIESAQGAFQPNLSVSIGPSLRYRLGSGGTTQVGAGSSRASGSMSVGVSSGYTIYNGEADRATLTQARQLAQASDITVDRTGQTVVYSLITSFFDVATSRELISVAEENLVAERDQLDRIRAFVDAGTRPISDRYAQEATVASAELQVIQTQRQLDLSTLTLVQTLQLDPLARYDFATPDTVRGEDELLAATVDTLVGRAYAQRPEIAAEQARIDAATQGIRIADAGKKPTISLSGSLGSDYSTLDDASGLGSQLFSQNPSASLGLSFSLPIFDRNRTDAADQQARIEYENELLAMVDLRQRIAVEVRQAVLDLNYAQQQLAAAERQLASSRLALDVEQTRYESGISTLVELTQARARAVAAEGQVVQARNAIAAQRYGLLYAVGTITTPRRP